MELQKGICFLCQNNKVIPTYRAENAFDVICSLFSNKILNIAELDDIRSSLKFCPICYHKLTILKCTDENINTIDLEDEDISTKCVLCRNGKVLFQIDNWPLFNKISEDLLSKGKDASYITCSDCLFYLDTRHEIKSKLVSKYPQLEVKSTNDNEVKRRSRRSDVLPHSIENKRNRAVVMNVCTRNSNEALMQKSFNYASLKKLKPLKHNRVFRNLEEIKSDSKFLNQIPCVLLKPFSNEHNKNTLNDSGDKGISAKIAHQNIKDVKRSISKCASSELKIAQPTLKKTIKHRQLYSKLIKLKKELSKEEIVKNLVVYLPKINILSKHKAKSRNYKHDPEIDKLIDKFNVLQRPTTASTNVNVEGYSLNDAAHESIETNAGKAKRKSVTFAEEKNVEIEYFQNDSTINSNNDHYETVVKKRNKKANRSDNDKKPDVLEENMLVEALETKSTQENKDDEEIESNDMLNTEITPKYVETPDNNLNNEDGIVMDDGKTIVNDDKDTESQHEESNVEKDVDRNEVKNKPKREKPKPLSKKNGSNSHIHLENVSEDSVNISSSESDTESTNPKSLPNKDKANDSDRYKDFDSQHAEINIEKVDKSGIKNRPRRGKPKPLSKKKCGNSLNQNSKNTSEDATKSCSEDNKETVISKSLPKEDEASGSDSADGIQNKDTDSQHEENLVEKEIYKSESKDKLKRNKPKPLSKKKKDKNVENPSGDSTNRSSPETDKEIVSSETLPKKDEAGSSDSADEIPSSDNDDSVSSDRQKEFCKEIELDCNTKVTDRDVGSKVNSPADDESCVDEVTKKDETNIDKKDHEGNLPSMINNDNNTDDINVDTEKDTGGNSKKSLDEHENECISDKKEDEVDGNDLMNEIKNDISSVTEVVTRLDDLKNLDREENLKVIDSESGKDLNFDNENKGSVEEVTEDTNADTSKIVENFEPNSFSGSEKNDELGISEDDTQNINSIITGMFPPQEQIGDILDEWKIIDKDSNEKIDHKRKMNEDDLNSSIDRKKKKVTFSEDLT